MTYGGNTIRCGSNTGAFVTVHPRTTRCICTHVCICICTQPDEKALYYHQLVQNNDKVVILIGEMHDDENTPLSSQFKACVRGLDAFANPPLLVVEMNTTEEDHLDMCVALQHRNQNDPPDGEPSTHLQVVQCFAYSGTPSSNVHAIPVDVRGNMYKRAFIEDNETLTITDLEMLAKYAKTTMLEHIDQDTGSESIRALIANHHSHCDEVIQQLEESTIPENMYLQTTQHENQGAELRTHINRVWECGSLAVDIEILRVLQASTEHVTIFYGGLNHCTRVARHLVDPALGFGYKTTYENNTEREMEYRHCTVSYLTQIRTLEHQHEVDAEKIRILEEQNRTNQRRIHKLKKRLAKRKTFHR